MQQCYTAVDVCMMGICNQGAALPDYDWPPHPSTPAAGGRCLQLWGAALVGDRNCLCLTSAIVHSALPCWQQHALHRGPCALFTEGLSRCREMYTGQKPWIGMSRDEVIRKVLAGERLIFPKQVPKAFQVRQQSHHGVLTAMQGQNAHCRA